MMGSADSAGAVSGLLRATVAVLLIVGAFTYGVGVGHYRWVPFEQLLSAREAVGGGEAPQAQYAGPDDELLSLAFTGEMSTPVMLPPASTIADIAQYNEHIFTPVGILWNAEERIDIVGAQQLDVDDVAPVLRVDFTVDGRARSAYAYGSADDQHSDAVLIIPGSGQNKARTIASGTPESYHCCLYDQLRGFDRFVLIKPNEGLRAVHDGERRLSDDFLINWHLNRGGSYSASYLVEAVALHLYLRQRFDQVVLAGLSQGGKAALIAALAGPEPDALVVASGYSVLSYSPEAPTVEWAGHNQIIIPGIASRLAPDRLAEDLAFPTLFTFGRQERGIYRVEAEEGLTCRSFADAEDVSCVVHDGGHVFPVPEILVFLEDALA